MDANPRREKPNDQGRSNIVLYSVLSLGTFVAVLVLVGLMVWKAETLVALGLSGNIYYIVLVPLGLMSAAFLFGALRSFAHFRGKYLGGVITLGGPVVLFALVLILGFKLPPPAANFPLTVYVHGSGGRQDLILRGKGSVVIDTGGVRRTAPISDKGDAFFPEIPANFRGQTISIDLDADGYEQANPNQEFTLNGSSVYLQARRKAGRITGHVQNRKGAPLAGVTIAIAGLTASTDAMGFFEITVPGEEMQPDLILKAVAHGYAPWSDNVTPNSNEITITLINQR